METHGKLEEDGFTTHGAGFSHWDINKMLCECKGKAGSFCMKEDPVVIVTKCEHILCWECAHLGETTNKCCGCGERWVDEHYSRIPEVFRRKYYANAVDFFTQSDL